MVTRVINLLYREVRGLHQAAYILALFALASQILALVRDRLLAHQFGAGSELDIYYAAFRVPDILFVLFASVLSVYVLLPFVTKAREVDEASAQAILSQLFTLFLLMYAVVAAAAFLLAPFVITWLFPGFTPDAHDETVVLMRILLLQPFLLGISSLYGVVTQLHHRFVIYALSPLLYNVGIIIGAVALYPLFGLAGLGYGVVLGALGHLLVQWPLVRKSTLAFRVVFQYDWNLLRHVAIVAIPRALTLSLGQLQLLVLVGLASTMAVGSVAVLQFAYNLQSVPLAIIGMSYSVAAFPVLAEMLAKQDQVAFGQYVTTALRHIIFWSLPIITLVIVLRAQIVRVLLGSGSFNWEDTRLTAAALGMFVITLAAQAVLLLVVRAFYAGGKTKIPLLVTALGTGVGALSAYVLTWAFANYEQVSSFFTTVFRLEGVDGVSVLMLPLGFAIGVILEALVMLVCFRSVFSVSLRTTRHTVAQAIMAAAGGGLAAYATLLFIVEGVNQDTFIGIFIQGAVGGLIGLATTVLIYWLLRSHELTELTKSFRAKLFRTDIVAPQPDII
jgi:putative peptidoglycan lipid II flippase